MSKDKDRGEDAESELTPVEPKLRRHREMKKKKNVARYDVSHSATDDFTREWGYHPPTCNEPREAQTMSKGTLLFSRSPEVDRSCSESVVREAFGRTNAEGSKRIVTWMVR